MAARRGIVSLDVPADRLRDVVRAVLEETDALLTEWDTVPLRGGAAAGAAGGEVAVFALEGTARVGAAERPWSAVLKVLAPVPVRDDPAHPRYWKREPLLYRSGLLDDLAGGLRAPRCYGCDERSDGTVWLWLERVREDGVRPWPLGRWALAARHLGQLNGAFAVQRALPDAPWLTGGRLRAVAEAHAPLVARIASAGAVPGETPSARRRRKGSGSLTA